MESLSTWAESNFLCKICAKGQPVLMEEENFKGLSSTLVWKCSLCGSISKAPTSTTFRTLEETTQRPKATINIKAVHGTILAGGTYKTLETILGVMDIPARLIKLLIKLDIKPSKHQMKWLFFSVKRILRKKED